jgi:integrase
MSIKRRTWQTKEGPQTAWVVRYSLRERHDNGKLKRGLKTFRTQKEAKDFEAQVTVDVAKGTHVPASKSVTVAEAGTLWIARKRGDGRERTTVDSYEQHLRDHIGPRIGHVKLAELTTPAVEAFRDELVSALRSSATARKVLGSLKMLLTDAVRRGLTPFNAASPARIESDKRTKRRLKAGVDFPQQDEVRRIIQAAPEGKARTLLMVTAFTGLRGSELRGLRWTDVNLEKGSLTVEQRADRFGTIGSPKSESGHRTIPIGSILMNTLRHLKVESTGKLVFGTRTDRPTVHSELVRHFQEAQVEAGIVDDAGKARYLGLHTLRHFAASLMLHSREHGGQGLRLQEAQARLGHATLAMTSDVYGHLLPVEDDDGKLAASERHLFAVG